MCFILLFLPCPEGGSLLRTVLELVTVPLEPGSASSLGHQGQLIKGFLCGLHAPASFSGKCRGGGMLLVFSKAARKCLGWARPRASALQQECLWGPHSQALEREQRVL